MFALDEARGTLALRQSVPCGGTVIPLALRPIGALYAAIATNPGACSPSPSMRARALTALGEAPLAQSMAHIAVDASGAGCSAPPMAAA